MNKMPSDLKTLYSALVLKLDLNTQQKRKAYTVFSQNASQACDADDTPAENKEGGAAGNGDGEIKDGAGTGEDTAAHCDENGNAEEHQQKRRCRRKNSQIYGLNVDITTLYQELLPRIESARCLLYGLIAEEEYKRHD